jgi:outer membrane protein assembly factor BamD
LASKLFPRRGRHRPPSCGLQASRFALIAVLSASGALVGCAPEPPRASGALDYTEHAKRDYERAMREFQAKNWEAADKQFNDIRKNYSYSRYARLAELRLADAQFQQDKLAEAISGYKSFAHDYPNDPEVPYARYQIAKAEYDSVSQSVFLPPLEERDLASVNDALSTIRNYLADFPGSPHNDELKYMLEVVLGLLARHELYVARYYLARDRFEAAAARVDHALTAFPHSGLEAEGLLLLAEIRLKQKRPEDARKLLEELLHQHPESPFSLPARGYLARLGPAEPVRTLQQPEPVGKPPVEPARPQ